MARVEVDRTSLLDGLGWNFFPFAGSTYNVRFGPCVRITFKKPRRIMRLRYINIGTREPQVMAAVIAARMNEESGKQPDAGADGAPAP